eukprot:UN30772
MQSVLPPGIGVGRSKSMRAGNPFDANGGASVQRSQTTRGTKVSDHRSMSGGSRRRGGRRRFRSTGDAGKKINYKTDVKTSHNTSKNNNLSVGKTRRGRVSDVGGYQKTWDDPSRRKTSAEIKLELEEKDDLDLVKFRKLRSGGDYMPVGLENNGNTCYFNSVIQSLITCESFVECIWSRKDIIDKDEKTLTKKELLLKYLFSNLCKYHHKIETEECLNIHKLLTAFRGVYSHFYNSCEHDTQEALMSFLDGLNDVEKKVGDLFRVNTIVERKLYVNRRNQPVKKSNDSGYVLGLTCMNKEGCSLTDIEEQFRYLSKWKEQEDKIKESDKDKTLYKFQQRTLIDSKSLPTYLYIHLERFTMKK